jgi:hypothetical protein
MSLGTLDGVLDGVLLGVLLCTWTAASLAALLGVSLAVTLGVLLGAGLILTAALALPDGAAFVVSAQNAKAEARTERKGCCFMTKYRSKDFLFVSSERQHMYERIRDCRSRPMTYKLAFW